MSKTIITPEMVKEVTTLIYKEELPLLNIGDIPLVFNDERSNPAFTAETSFVTLNTIHGEVVDIVDVLYINFNTSLLSSEINTYFPSSLRRQALIYTMKAIVRHELRHAWQSKYNKALLINANNSYYKLFTKNDPHGLHAHEIDANEYALSCTKTKFEYIVAESFKIRQEISSKKQLTFDESIMTLKNLLSLCIYTIIPFLAK